MFKGMWGMFPGMFKGMWGMFKGMFKGMWGMFKGMAGMLRSMIMWFVADTPKPSAQVFLHY